jgi:N-acetyl-anhydromuramyl-L-alanine amidase AmpD
MQRSLSAIPYVEAANWSRSVPPQPKWWIVLHCMEWPEKPDSAEWCAGFFRDQKTDGVTRTSAHACVDSDSIVQCVPWDRVAWHAPGANQFGIGIEHAGFVRQNASGWSDAYSQRMLDLSAWLVAELCDEYAIPVEFVDAAGLLQKKRGITTHEQVSKAWKKSTHGDPGGDFPIETYVRAVARYSASMGTV